MHFSKITALFFASLATAGTISTENSDGDVIRYKLGNNVWSNLAPESGAVAYKLSSATPGDSGAASQTTNIVAKRDDVHPTLDELKANTTLLMEWVMAYKPADADLDGDEVDLIARVDPGWSAKLCRCIINMNTCLGGIVFNDWTIQQKLSHCFQGAVNVRLCMTRTQSSYKEIFHFDFAPEAAVNLALDQLYINFDGR